jgi:hypothetical protein
MGVVGDESRVSELIIRQPYMGMGRDWDEPTTSWLEPWYKNMCINACWELYGSKDVSHLLDRIMRFPLYSQTRDRMRFPNGNETKAMGSVLGLVDYIRVAHGWRTVD